MKDLLEKIEARQRLVEETVERLEITRATVLELAAEGGTLIPEPLPPGYREILALFEEAGSGLRVKDICQELDTGLQPRHTESMRAKLKRLVRRGILTEPDPGLFTLPQPAPPTEHHGWPAKVQP
ncbi:hypothetical protein ACH4SK_07495 [Streptomyces inhibens]|uniref:hypothetical protein n=1 Tax=Streptomyces inhibens TaxID=2293571 RepID=UPI003787A3E6